MRTSKGDTALQQFMMRSFSRGGSVEGLIGEVHRRLTHLPDEEFIRDPRSHIIRVASQVVSEREPSHRVETESDPTERSESSLDRPSLSPTLQPCSTPEQLKATLVQLSPLYQAVLLLHWREKCSFEHMAKRLGVTVDRVRRCLRKANHAFMTVLGAGYH
jgi:DNA-directed RNA polymerase specialized sigma24 family protein